MAAGDLHIRPTRRIPPRILRPPKRAVQRVLTTGVTTSIFMAMESSLQREIGQTQPFQSLEQEASLSLQRTAALLSHTTAEWLKPYGITPTQYNVLRILRGAGGGGLCRNEVRDRMVTQVPDVTRLLDRLEEAGLIERTREGTDRRFVTTRITDEGLRLLEELDEPIAERHRHQLGEIGKADLETLVRLLARVRRACGRAQASTTGNDVGGAE